MNELEVAGIRAWVEVEQEKLAVHGIQKAEGETTVTCWIPSEAGKEFSVHWNPGNVTYRTVGTLFVDGLGTGSVLFLPEFGSSCIKYIELGPNDRRCLLFSNLQLTDDETHLNKPVAQEMGEIRLVVMEVKVTNKFLLQAGTGSTLRGELPTGVMHERAKKVLGHCVRLGSSNPIPSRITYSGQYVRTLAAFIFKYRPIEILRANGITPPDPNRKRAIEETKPTELEDEEDKDISSIKQEIARLQAQLEEMEGQRPKKRAKVKREVKKEDTGVPFRSGEVIDLT